MIKIKNNKRVKIFIIISVTVLIVLVWCVAWINTVASERSIKEGQIRLDESTINKEDNVGCIKEDNIEISKGEKIKSAEESNIKSVKEDSIDVVIKDSVESDKEDNIDVGKEDNAENTKDDNDENAIDENIDAVKKDSIEDERKSEEALDKGKIVGEDGEELISEESMPNLKDVPEGEVYDAYNNTLIIGDSRTEGFKLYAGVKNAAYFCRKSLTIDKIVEGKELSVEGQNVSVYDLLDEANYDKVIIGVGLNELGWNYIGKFIEDYGRLIDEIKERQPETTIFLQAVLPVSKYKNDNDKVHNNAQIYWYNENIIKLASDKGVKFVNPAAVLVDVDGCLVAEATADGIHLNSEYCKIWAKYLAGLV